MRNINEFQPDFIQHFKSVSAFILMNAGYFLKLDVEITQLLRMGMS
jgi:hypothetical protein